MLPRGPSTPQWWLFEVLILMSGWLANPDLSVAVMGILLQTSGAWVGRDRTPAQDSEVHLLAHPL